MRNFDLNKLVKVSSYAARLGKSNELIRLWIRRGVFKEDIDYLKIDGVIFIILKD